MSVKIVDDLLKDLYGRNDVIRLIQRGLSSDVYVMSKSTYDTYLSSVERVMMKNVILFEFVGQSVIFGTSKKPSTMRPRDVPHLLNRAFGFSQEFFHQCNNTTNVLPICFCELSDGECVMYMRLKFGYETC